MCDIYPLVNVDITMEITFSIAGKTLNFYGHFQERTVTVVITTGYLYIYINMFECIDPSIT